MHINKIKRIAI